LKIISVQRLTNNSNGLIRPVYYGNKVKRCKKR